VSQPESQNDDDVEIDVGRYVRRVLARWWIVAISVVVVVGVALVTQTGSSSETWTARTLVFLGQPLSSSGSPLNITLGSNPATPGILIRNDELLARAAGKAGLKPGALKGHVSSQVLSQAITKANYTPLVNIVVQGLAKDKVAPASKAVAEEIITATNQYPSAQQKVLKAYAASQKLILASANDRLERGNENLDRITNLQGITPLEKATLTGNAISNLNGITSQISQVSDSYTQTVQILAALQSGVAKGQIVENPRAVRSTATSGGANIGVAVILGLIIGIVLALVSYAVRPPRPRSAA
jgi:hypothetical protein